MKNQNQKKAKSARPSVQHNEKRGVLERIGKIHALIAAGKYPNCSTIARQLEVSVRTAARDIEFVRDRCQWPIEYDEKRHGFYFTEKMGKLPWVAITEAELFAVCISEKVLDLYRGMSFQKPLELAFAKLAHSLDDEERYTLENLGEAFSIGMFAPEDPDLRLLELATRAVARRQGLKFTYRKPGEKQGEARSVHPYHVRSYEGRLYLLAYDPSRGDARKFVLSRMTDAVMTEERFVRPKDFDARKAFSTSLGVMSGRGDYQVVIEMDAWLTDILRGRRLHTSQTVEELPGGGSQLKLRLSCLEEIEQQVLSWGTHATVTSPQELRDRVGRIGKELAGKYGGVVES